MSSNLLEELIKKREKMSKLPDKQLDLLVKSMQKHPDIATANTKRDKEDVFNIWKRIVNELNSLGPPVKSVTAWRKIWSNKKKYAKYKLAENKNHKETTGSSFDKHTFTTFEETIIKLCALDEIVERSAHSNELELNIWKKVYHPSYTDTDPLLDGSKTLEELKNLYVYRRTRGPPTQEEIAKRRAKNREYKRLKRASETPEEVAKRRDQQNVKQIDRWHQYRASETPEQKAKRHARRQEYKRLKKACETPEEVTKRRARDREYYRRKKELLQETQQESCQSKTDAEIAKRRARRRESGIKCRALDTPEQAAARRARSRQIMRLIRARETPEQTAKRLARCREYQHARKNKKTKTELLVQETKHESCPPPSRTIHCDTGKHIPENIKKERFQDEYSIFECSETSFITQETYQNSTNFDSLLDVSTTQEKFKNKETENQYCKRNERQKRMPRKVNEDSEVTLERIDCIKMFLDAEARRDKHFVYGEYIATRLRNCNRGESEIRKAKDLLQTILFYLNAGVYNCVKNELIK